MLLRRTYEMYIHYTDFHDVDEDETTISLHGGYWSQGNWRGVVNRQMMNNSTITSDYVASANEHHLLHPDGYHNVGYKIPTDQLIRMYRYLYKIYLMESNRL